MGVGPAGIEPTTSTVFAGELILFPGARAVQPTDGQVA